jgi:hypothetical protein
MHNQEPNTCPELAEGSNRRTKAFKYACKTNPKENFNFFSNALNKKIKTPDTQATTKKEMKHTADKDNNNSTDRTPAGNSGLSKKPNLWFIEQLCFLKTFVVADNFVQLNRLLRKAASR